MIRTATIAAAALLLAGCAGTQQAEAPRQQIKTVEVRVKVKEPCIDAPPQRPQYQTGRGEYPGDKEAAAILAADFERAEQYGYQWEAAAAGCLVVPPAK